MSMTVSKVRAGASGILRPPSQCLIASRLNPNVFENLACVMPSRFRIAFTSTSWGTCALNPSCFPARKASTSFRPFIICSNCVFMLSPMSLQNALENTIGSCPQRVALCHGQVFFLILGKNRNKKNRKSLVAPDIHNPGPTALSHSLACDPDLSKSAGSPNQIPTFRVSRNQCYDVRTLLLAKELVGNREVSRRLDNRRHNSLVLHWTPLGQ